ncbi:MAG: DUF2225 domain-containing protein [Clostridiaceae bacterium]|jgi:uncharacterized protein (DUF2225 family)|nr:DUF2225 domain-containing protein [Clostridiaceae bacterium]
MNDSLYGKEVDCPVCSKKFNVTKVKSRACKVLKRDSDFCVHYEGINPILYDAWVCENCGYASQADKFLDITPREADRLKDNLMPRWKKRSLDGERDIDTAIEAFKLVLISYQFREAKSSDLARVCMRIAWLYRYKGDEEELKFIGFALKHYKDTYEKENFPVDKLDEYTCMYMIGELCFRTGSYEEAVKWFSRLISSEQARKKPTLIEAARDQYQLVKEKLK